MKIDSLTLYLIGMIIIISIVGIIGYLDGREGTKKPSRRQLLQKFRSKV